MILIGFNLFGRNGENIFNPYYALNNRQGLFYFLNNFKENKEGNIPYNAEHKFIENCSLLTLRDYHIIENFDKIIVRISEEKPVTIYQFLFQQEILDRVDERVVGHLKNNKHDVWRQPDKWHYDGYYGLTAGGET